MIVTRMEYRAVFKCIAGCPGEYDLEQFGLNEQQIRQDCAFFYDTFLPPWQPLPATPPSVEAAAAVG